ncbi:glycosyltransferase family 39 protein [Janthinobacterium sp. 17J80-10]|uniref:glycosyltransferase family 39 protein n=1 Tax=Janthinobacterium sp. 17J80-10 TaxID=2497863 RepID=UPI001005941A|nr:glycosyltransferase family 39 protein [Janthinobacterium sp. 17J80-10]QAU34156.1 glycosyltransferase family 39 protein [Janthinobacterium sp. 17J80-10]
MPTNSFFTNGFSAKERPATAELPQSTVVFWLLFLLFCIIWFYTLQARTLVPTDEGRYAEMAREMAASGNFITPRLNGIKYFEKPPLQTWINALTFQAFGLGEWQARLWTGLCGLFGIALVSYTGRRIFNARTGLAAGVVLASSLYWSMSGHLNSLDMGLAAMMALALCSFLLAQQDDTPPRARRNWMLLCWAGMALSVLSKGLIGIVLPGAVLVLYALLQRDFNLWRRLHAGGGLTLFLAITAPWFVLVSIKNPEFPHFFFIHEHFQRFTSNVHRREGNWHYFIPILLAGSMPWLGTLAQGLWHGWRPAPTRFQPGRLLLIWSIFIFAFFSLSGSKLPSYILPIFPALALLIAHHLDRASGKTLAWTAGLFSACCALGLVLVSKVPAMAKNAYELPLYQQNAPWIAAALGVGLAGGLLAVWLARRQRDWALLALAAGGFLAGQLAMLGHEPLGRYKAGIAHVPAIQAALTPDTPLYTVGLYEQALPFYLQRTMMLVGYADEMAFGLQLEPGLWLPNQDDFVARWRADHARGKQAVAILRTNIYTDLQGKGVPMHIIAQDPRRIIVTNDIGKPGHP